MKVVYEIRKEWSESQDMYFFRIYKNDIYIRSCTDEESAKIALNRLMNPVTHPIEVICKHEVDV